MQIEFYKLEDPGISEIEYQKDWHGHGARITINFNRFGDSGHITMIGRPDEVLKWLTESSRMLRKLTKSDCDNRAVGWYGKYQKSVFRTDRDGLSNV